MPNFKITKTKKIIISALLLAMFILLDRQLSINTQILTINLSLVPIMLAALILGPYYATVIGALGDLIGSIFWPFGAYNVGFTISSALTGLIFGMFLYENPNKQKNIEDSAINYNKNLFGFVVRAIISNILVTVFINILLNSLWLKIMYEKAYIYYLGQRVVTQVIMLPIYIILIVTLRKILKPTLQKYVYKIEE